MANTVVLGMQWGDEGKGKIVDLICPAFDAVARFQGGHNAGHTVKFADKHFALHLLPSGILHDDMRCVLGNGMVISPPALFAEIESVSKAGVDITGRLLVSDRAQVILSAHAALDRAREAARGQAAIGTTARGIGPTYETKAGRTGIRIGDLLADGLETHVERLVDHLAKQLEALGSDEVPAVADVLAECQGWAERFRPLVADTSSILDRAISAGGSVLFEGAQGALLDLDHGTYPYVTSSNATAGGVATGTGVAPTRLTGVLGVVKAYTTRVGGGPFVTELHDDVGEHLRRRGNEFGTSTGRPRRCGHFDAVAVRYACRLNGTDAVAVTKLDVMDELDEVKLCVAYRYKGEEIRDFPAAIDVLEKAEPVYETMPGWKTKTVGMLDLEDLPRNARAYLDRVAETCDVALGMISTGPRREETLLIDNAEMRRLIPDLETVIAGRGTP